MLYGLIQGISQLYFLILFPMRYTDGYPQK